MRYQLAAIVGGLVAVVLATTQLLAGGNILTPAPEIDGASLTTGLGLLSAGILIVRARRRNR